MTDEDSASECRYGLNTSTVNVRRVVFTEESIILVAEQTNYKRTSLRSIFLMNAMEEICIRCTCTVPVVPLIILSEL